MSTYTRRNRQTGTLLTVARAVDEGLDDSDGAWVTVCEPHSTIVNSATRALAMDTYPLDFCDFCRRLNGADFGEYANSNIDRDLADLAR